MKKTSASTSIPFLTSLKQNSAKDIVKPKETDYLLSEEIPPDRTSTAAHGIATLFNLFSYELHTFQFIKPDGGVHTETFKDAKTALKTSLKYSNAGYDVFFMVNEGDGIVHENKRVCRSQASVKYLSRCFIDTDNCPVEKVNAYLSSIALVPHLIVESSPGRYHYYFFFEQLEKTDDNIATWKAIQQILHRLGDPSIHSPSKTLGTDATMHDYSKILRVPGFIHIKKLTLVKIVSTNDIPLYTLDDLFTITNANSFLTYHNGHAATIDNEIDLNGTTIYQAGERYQTLQTLSMTLANDDTVSKEKHFHTFTNFVIFRLDNSDNVYLNPDNTLTTKSIALFDSAFRKIVTEQKSAVVEIHSSLAKVDEPKPSPWELPDSFYLSAPNGFGDVVRQVMDASLYPCAALTFGTFLTGLSILKAKTHYTPGGSSPAIYTLNIAMSGGGKNDPMTMLQNTFQSLGLGGLIENEIRSDRGVYEHLEVNHGIGLFLLDEVAHLLKAIQKPDAATHHAYINKALKDLYTKGAMKGVSCGRVAKGKGAEKLIILDYPAIAFCGFTTPGAFNGLFNMESVLTGLFPRFICIVAKIKDLPANPNADKGKIIKSELFAPFIEAQELDNDGKPVEPIQAVSKIKTRFTDSARAFYTALQADYRSKAVALQDDPENEGLSGLYSRVAEHIERVATLLSRDEIDLATVEYTAKFIESRHNATLASCHETVFSGDSGKKLAQENAITRAITKLELPLKSEVFKRTRRHFTRGGIKEFNNLIEELEAIGKIKISPVKTKGRKGTILNLFDVLDD